MHTFIDPLRRAEIAHARRLAVVDGDTELDFGSLIGRCRSLVGGLQRLGVGRGDRVAIVAANSHRYLETYLAVPAAGFVLVPLNARHTDSELVHALHDAGARVLITDRPPSPVDDAVDEVVRVPDGYADLVSGAAGRFADDLTPATLAGLFYTGGTTGAAKGVMLSHGNLVANTWTLFAWSRLHADDRWLVVAPLFHAAGSLAVLASVWVGATQVVLPGFDPATTLDAIEQHAVTATLLVPTMMAAVTDEQQSRPRSVATLRLLSHGASPVTTEVLRRAARTFPTTELLHLYGATETSPIATTLPHEERLLDGPQARSCGQPAVGVEVRPVRADDTSCAVGEVGEVTIRGANVMQGYWNRPAETAAALRGGWYHTGDLGHLDDSGHLFLVDRAKDMIVSGGENVYSTEVEEALARHPAVAEVAVFGVPDERWGEAVHAVVVLRAPATPDELRSACRAEIAAYKVPKGIDIVDEPLPKSGAGKILKRELREPHWAGHDTRIG